MDDMGPEEDVDDDEPGKLNNEAKNKGRKSSSEDKTGKNVTSGRLAAALERERRTTRKLNAAMEQLEDLQKQMKRMKKQVALAAETQGRKSTALPAEITGLLRKGGIDASELMASGQKLTVDEVDAVLMAVGGLPPEKRIQLKTEMSRRGIMDEGRVQR